MSNWSHDITKAPRGKISIETIPAGHDSDGNEKIRAVRTQVIEWVWVATKCGKVIKSHWIHRTKTSAGRWLNLATNEQPLAWMRYVVPDHPGFHAEGEAA